MTTKLRKGEIFCIQCHQLSLICMHEDCPNCCELCKEGNKK